MYNESRATNKCKIFNKVLIAYKNMDAEVLSKLYNWLYQFIDIFSIHPLHVCLTIFSDSVFPGPTISEVFDTSLKY